MSLFAKGDVLSQNAKVEATGMRQMSRLVRTDGQRLQARRNALRTQHGGVAEVNIRIHSARVLWTWMRMSIVEIWCRLYASIYSPLHVSTRELSKFFCN